MAMQKRRGAYKDFDPRKMLPGEGATVISGDPHSVDGTAIYECFAAGDVKRMATYEDMVTNVHEAAGDAIDEQIEDKLGELAKTMRDTISEAESAISTARTEANSAVESAQKADVAAMHAEEAAKACEGIEDGTRIAELEKKVEQIISVLNNVISTE